MKRITWRGRALAVASVALAAGLVAAVSPHDVLHGDIDQLACAALSDP
jgi:hypothetical protein